MMQNQRDEQGQFSDEARQDEMDLMEQEERAEQGSGAEKARSRRGFAGMSQEKRREIASKGGRSQGKENNSGNFANNREKAVAAGRLGGQNSRGGGRQSERAEEQGTEADAE